MTHKHLITIEELKEQHKLALESNIFKTSETRKGDDKVNGTSIELKLELNEANAGYFETPRANCNIER